MRDLKNKTLLVTGASSGIGRECAVGLSEAGATLIITGRNHERLRETSLSMANPERHVIIQADLLTEEGLQAVLQALPKLDGIVFSAGVGSGLPARFIQKKHIASTFGVNFDSIVLLMAKVLSKQLLNNNAGLVFIGSAVTKYPFVGTALYAASKMALDGYVRVLALELASKQIRCNLISPHFVKTPLLATEHQTIMEEAIEKHKNIHPLGMGEPKDVADAVIYFLSEEAKWITGTNLFLGGEI